MNAIHPTNDAIRSTRTKPACAAVRTAPTRLTGRARDVRSFVGPWLTGLLICWAPSLALGQNLGASGTTSVLSSGFSESVAVTGFSGVGPVLPPFGGYDPAADARLGLSLGGLQLGITAGQGSRRSMVSQTGVLTLPNGGTGSLFHGQLRPFVTGIVPVVGWAPAVPSPLFGTPAGPLDLKQRIALWQAQGTPPQAQAKPSSKPVKAPEARRDESAAEQGDVGVQAIEDAGRERWAAEDAEAEKWTRRAAAAEAAGQTWSAIQQYRRAARAAHGARRVEINDHLRRLERDHGLARP